MACRGGRTCDVGHQAFFEPVTVNGGFRFEDAAGHGFNNPTLAALKEARSHHTFKERAKHCVVVSLSTGLASLNKKTHSLPSDADGMAKKTMDAIRSPEREHSRIKDLIAGLVAVATNTEMINHEVCQKLTLGSVNSICDLYPP